MKIFFKSLKLRGGTTSVIKLDKFHRNLLLLANVWISLPNISANITLSVWITTFHHKQHYTNKFCDDRMCRCMTYLSKARDKKEADSIVQIKHWRKISKMKLTDNVVRNYRVAKIFRENTDRINRIDFSSDGNTLISSSDDDSIVIYDCQNGT